MNADGSTASFPQYWKRNTLVIDLSAHWRRRHSSRPRLPEETTWPVRVAVRVRPGSVGQIEIQGEERNVLPVGRRRHRDHRPRVRAQRVHAEDRGYLHFLGADAGVRREDLSAGGSRSRIRVTHRSAEAAHRSGAGSASDIITPAEAQPSPPPGS